MRYPTRLFSLDLLTKTFVGEASTLTQGGRISMFSRIYDDACDEGLILNSDRTGSEAAFYVHETKKDDNEIKWWHLLPTNEALRRNPSLQGWSITIFNT